MSGGATRKGTEAADGDPGSGGGCTEQAEPRIKAGMKARLNLRMGCVGAGTICAWCAWTPVTPIRRCVISEIARAAVRAGAATADEEKRAFRPAARDPRWVPNPARPSRCRRVLRDRVPPAHAGLREPPPGLSSRSGGTLRRMTRCPPGPCRCWAAVPVWSGPRAAESRFVECQRSSPKQENRRGDSSRRGRSL